MVPELEAKWLHIDKTTLRQRLKAAGASCVQLERRMVRQLFDFPDGRLAKQQAWVRVRDEGNVVTISYKQQSAQALDGMQEAMVTVDDFAKACAVLEALGLKSRSFQETMRESWQLGEAQIELDTWPWLEPLVEIEAADEAAIRKTAATLQLDFAEAVYGGIVEVYQAAYKVTAEEVRNWPDIRFSDVPDWLAAQRR